MSDVTKIALTGLMRSGKDAVANRLWIEHDFAYPVGFGSALKVLADQVFAHSIDVGRKPRAIYQSFGQLMRTIDEDVWIKHAERAVHLALNQRDTRGIVIKDLRQPNEYEWCRANGFVIIRVIAPLEARVKRAEIAGDAFEMADLDHETESHSDSFEVDFEIVNDGSLDELHAEVDEIISTLQADATGI